MYETIKSMIKDCRDGFITPEQVTREIVNLFRAEVDKLTPYVYQVTKENNGLHEGNVLIDPVGLAALEYWFDKLLERLEDDKDIE